jgi:YidC/Oxa1 family membrane protein insertase
VEKRLLLAALLSLGVLLLWEAVAPKPSPPNSRPGQSAPTPSAVREAPQPAPAAPELAPPPAGKIGAAAEERVVVDLPLYRATFSNKGAVLTSFVLKKYDDDQGNPLELVHHGEPNAPLPFSLDFRSDAAAEKAANGSLYRVERSFSAGEQILLFQSAAEGRSFEKRFRLGRGYLIQVEMTARGVGEPFVFGFGPGLRNLSEKEKQNRFIGGSGGLIFDGDGIHSFSPEKVAKNPFHEKLLKGGYVGLEDNYFLAALLPAEPATARLDASGAEHKVELRAGLETSESLVAQLYLGPKELEVLSSVNLHLEETVRFRAMGLPLGVIARPLIWLMKASYRYVIPNWGVAILVATFLIRLLLFPLMHKSYVGMKKMQKLQPKMNAIREKYKKARTDAEQRNKMNQELMALYQAEGYNPMSGCLPMIIQMPILLAFYVILERMIELRHAPFAFWIHDLSAKDPTYVLVILMTASMFLQQKMTPAVADPAQRRIFLFMPLMWGFFLKDMPSGLVLYWLFSNLLTIGQQLIINRLTAEEPAPRRRPKG